MKYGESAFDVLYLLTAVVLGLVMLKKGRGATEKLMGIAVLILGFGDAFHLVPRVINYFSESDMTMWLGLGKLITSITMTVFYVCMYYILLGVTQERENLWLTLAVWFLAALRTGLCLLEQNEWFSGRTPLLWAIIRNVPFVILGALIVVLWFRRRDRLGRLRFIWLWVTLSFLFYIPVTVGAGFVPMLGMLMLPKTICYVIIAVTFTVTVVKEALPERILRRG
ncbi:MAG: hypothetical protein IJM18_02075 [Clostridia bacterium]|nr:hypothetical protein [Clostridia bacterium]